MFLFFLFIFTPYIMQFIHVYREHYYTADFVENLFL